MDLNLRLPSYAELFGALDFKVGDEARSVYSPAAYLADLLQLLEDSFGDASLAHVDRRKDIYAVLLDADNTFTERPYLDIVNQILVSAIYQILHQDDEQVSTDHKQAAVYANLRESRAPFQLPFDLDNEQLKLYLHYLNTSAEPIYKHFALEPDYDTLARQYLGLSQAVYQIITSPLSDESELKACYGLADTKSWTELTEAASFMRASSLTAKSLRELLFQNLAEGALDPESGQPERTQAASFFINDQLGGYVSLDADEERLLWSDGSASIPVAWFERVNRFVRLATQSGISFSDLDLMLRSCCQNQLDAEAIRIIAVIKQFHDRYDLPVDVVCSLLSPLNTLGIGDEKTPQDFFNRVFNLKFTEIEKKYIAASAYIPAFYAASGYTRLECSGDLLAFENKEYRRRLTKALAMSERDLSAIVNRFRNKYASDPRSTIFAPEAQIGLPTLSALYRISTLASVLDISYDELFGLLDLLEREPSIRKDNNFDLLINAEPQSQDCYRILEQGDVRDGLWLLQMLSALVTWMQANDFSSAELNQILSGRYQANAEANNRSQKIAALDNLYQQCKLALLTADVFVSDRFSPRAARIIQHVLMKQDNGVLSKRDQRLLRFDATLALEAAYEVLDQLSMIHMEDFQKLGLEQRWLDKIYTNLIIKGYLTPEGVIVESKLPRQAAEFSLSSDFSQYSQPVFDLIQTLCVNHAYMTAESDAQTGELSSEPLPADDQSDDTADGQGEDATDPEMIADGQGEDATDPEMIAESQSEDAADPEMVAESQSEDATDPEMMAEDIQENITTKATGTSAGELEVSFYPSDLEAFDTLSEAQRDELYDNLIFNGYIDASGTLLQSDFFCMPENVVDFRVNADLSIMAGSVFAVLMRRVEQFESIPLVLDTAIFEELALSPAAIDDLVENLSFNGYIDQQKRFSSKRSLLELPTSQFQLALAFYSQQLRILTAIKTQIDTFRTSLYTLTREAFSEIADAAVARQVVHLLAMDYLINNRIEPGEKAFFLNQDNLVDFDLGADFSAGEQRLIFEQIASILAEQQKYQLPLSALQKLNFNPAETAELLEMLIVGGSLTEELLLPQYRIAYFLNINNALEFSIPAFTDYNKDIFFILHTVAKESAAAIDEIVTTIKAQAESQLDIVFSVLQEALGVEADLIKVASHYLLRGLEHALEAFLLPVLATVDSTDKVSSEPDDKEFNLLYKRLTQFALLAAKLRLSPAETEIIFRDQNLAEKFPEKLSLPADMDVFDALLEDPSGTIYVFKNDRYWAYSASDYQLQGTGDHPLTDLSDRLAGLTSIDAAFTDHDGSCYLVAGNTLFSRAKGSIHWLKQTRRWGQAQNSFDDPARIDTAFQDTEGKTYLFADRHYVRYSSADYATVDEGYPLTISGNWEHEGLNQLLPPAFKESLDASFQGTDGKTYLFKNDQYVSSDALASPIAINTSWGRVRNNFSGLQQLDAAYRDGADTYFFAGDQLIVYQDSIENDGVYVREGYPQSIEAHFANLPAEFERGLEAAFKGSDGRVHFFKDGRTLAWTPGETIPEALPIRERWGMVTNTIVQTGKVDAAFVGLDGKTYLFSAQQYVRYSGADYSQVDEGYPRNIAADWAGLQQVDAAFVLDGKTYLFGTDSDHQIVYVRYSTRDYSIHDQGYPKAPDDNWWNLPAALVEEDAPFKRIDAVFVGKDNLTYLFSRNRFITFDNKHRWWSEPQELHASWDSIPFDGVDAAFVGKDGKTYIFYDTRYIRYSNTSYTRIDDRYPKDISLYWGNVVNNIARTGRIDAGLVLEAHELIDGVDQLQIYTYLFSGNQYVRYTGEQYETVDTGYPKYIASSLKNEPRFSSLSSGFESGIDAAFADRRTIYLFKGSECQVLSDTLNAVYEQSFANPGCAFLEEGSLLVEEDGRWQHYSALEATTVIKTKVSPVTLRSVAPDFKHGLDAVLQGLDGNTYLFKGQDCFNLLLNRAYPLAEEWGRPRNNIYLHNTINAAFVGRDSRTYLFSGDQFFSYSGHDYTSTVIDGNPQYIKEHWGGLNNVALAFVRDQKTYLLEKADLNGNFRYVCYSTPDYSRPDAGFPRMGTMDFWQIPAEYQLEGFDEVNAVLFDGDNMFLIMQDQYLQYNDKSHTWAYPRPLNRYWRNFPLDRLTFPRVKTAFTSADGSTYFFSDESFFAYPGQGSLVPAPIKDSWGLMHNNFIQKGGSHVNKVDAAFVFQQRTTFLFSGDQYVRYSGTDYRYVDQGYPKALLTNLRQEQAFKNLPDTFEDMLSERIASQAAPVINAVFANDRTVYLLIGEHCYAASQSLTASYDLSMLGHVRNRLLERNRVDASFVGPLPNGSRATFLFSAEQYVRYSSDDYSYVDEGYPRSIAAGFAAETGAAPFPDDFNDSIDAALYGADGKVYLFKAKQYLKMGDANPGAIKDFWGKVRNVFGDTPTEQPPIDAAFIAPAGGLYAFKGSQYVRYHSLDQEFVDDGYPKAIKDSWGNLPVAFEAAIDGAFVFEGKTYLIKGNDYVRYSDSQYQAIDRMYPQAFKYRWGAWADYLLSDIKVIARFKELQDSYASADDSLVEFLNPPPEVIKSPYEMLATLFGWDIDEIEWLKRHNGFLRSSRLFEEQFQLELLIKIFDIFATAQKLGAAPSDLFANVWQKLYMSNDVAQAAETLYRYLAQKQSEQDWQVLAGQMHNELNLIKRDALMTTLIARHDRIANARDLYEHFLIDVEMGSSGVTSRIQEAIAATQLYFHRYFVNLEPVQARDGEDQQTRTELKRWWKWMKNYRVWEANRKVFLYPENYIRPELRDTKTPGFKTLEEDLLQGEISTITVQRAYKKYLDEYTEVSRLTIAGGYVYQPTGESSADRNLVLFGRTKTDPRRYYYRMAAFSEDQALSTEWTPWQRVDVQIDADKVYPVYAFDRVFVFWARTEAVARAAPTMALTTTKSGDTQNVSSNAPTSYVIKIYYSFYNLNKEWVPAQALTSDIAPEGRIDDINLFNTTLKLFVENSDKLNIQGQQLDHENIVINCSYTLSQSEVNQAFFLTPELYTERADKPNFTNRGQELFQQIFDEPPITNAVGDMTDGGQARINPADVVMFNTLEKSTDGPWFSFDYKGGSFLCKPLASPLSRDAWPRHLHGNSDNLPDWSHIDAAFATPDGKSYFFDNATTSYVINQGGTFSSAQSSKTRWGLVRNTIAETGVVDAGLTLLGKLYLFSGNQYLSFSNGLDLADADCPKMLSTNPDRLPGWQHIKAAFMGLNNKAYFFNTQGQFVTLENGQLSSAMAVVDSWGKIRPANVVAAFSIDDSTYLAYGKQYLRYSSGSYASADTGYPQAFNTISELPGLRRVAAAAAIEPQKLTFMMSLSGNVYFQYSDEKKMQRLTPTPGQDADRQDFRRHLNDWPLDAMTITGTHIYAFKRKNEAGESYSAFCMYDLEAKAETEDGSPAEGSAEQKGRWTYHNIVIVDSQNKRVMIDQALVGKDGNYYLFAGQQYMRSAEWVTLIEGDTNKIIRWNPEPGTIMADWLVNRIAKTGVVDAAIVIDTYTYLFSGDQYIRYTGGAYDWIDDSYPKLIRDNQENLPNWDQIGAAVKTPDNTIYFFDNRDQTYIQSNKLTDKLPSRPRWGVIRNNFTEQGVVNATYMRGNQLFLTSGSQFIRYTLDSAQTPDSFVDTGYPKNITYPMIFGVDLLKMLGINKIDAGFTVGDTHLYLFTGQFYFKLGPGVEPDSLPWPQFIQGNWGNLPYLLRLGLDSALQRGDALFLFKGDQYARYTNNSAPYEIVEARYDIIRLTTSTAYKLNQKLFAGGVAALLSLNTQEIDELPSFSTGDSTPTNIKVRPNKVVIDNLPVSSNLDFRSANGLYYWEIFFHAPFLIAQALNTGQKFEEAKEWFEYIFDPTDRANYWHFLPFQATDRETIDDLRNKQQIRAYLDDPFDPHAIAALRFSAYRKAIVMSYVSNLIDWGDMLFRQYTRESIDESRMLYILAYDLLGEKPTNLGTRILPRASSYAGLLDSSDEYDLIIELPGPDVVGNQTLAIMADTPHKSVSNPYFFVPENSQFGDYWGRVEDRLYKIRHSLNILGFSQPLPLFEPPIDPMALVRAVSSGAPLSSALASLNIPVPHYRFIFLLRKAQDLVQKLNGFGSDLLIALEKKDAEELNVLQNRQEGVILKMTRLIKEAQVQAAAETVKELEASLQGANKRVSHYQGLIDTGLLPIEQAQIVLMSDAAAAHLIASVLKISAAIVHALPEALIGPFILGIMQGGNEGGNAIRDVADFSDGIGQGLSTIAEVLGTYANHLRMAQDWDVQLNMAQSDVNQISHQLEGARLQVKIAQRELEIQDKEIEHNAAIKTFMQAKFSNAQLYQWMTSKLAGIYFQTYSMAYDMARAAEKAFQFERGLRESEASYIQPLYWDTQKHGLLAGVSLGLDLDRLEKAAIESGSRSFEITKNISLIDLDPLAFVQLLSKESCEFALSEALFDYDFPGHYRRQIKTVALTFAANESQRLDLNATLTQLGHKTVLEPDTRAVKYLLDPKDQPPLTLRSDWKTNQQIVLSHVDDYEKNNGLFELRFDDDRYLPFEGTGAVSNWRLELNGKKGSYNLNELLDVTITLKYSAAQGGATFASAVKGMLKPYATARLIDLAREFPDDWQAFLSSDQQELALTMTRDMFPNMSGGKISGIFTHTVLQQPGDVSLILNQDKSLTLKDGTFLATSGLTISNRGSQWTFTISGDKHNLQNINLVLSYTARVE